MSIDTIVTQVNSLPQLKSWPADDLLNAADTVAQALGAFQDTTLVTQTYKFLAAVRKIDVLTQRERTRAPVSGGEDRPVPFNTTRVKLLRPKLAYAVSRKRELSPFFQVLDSAIGKVRDADDFDHLMSFAEAVIAYHRFKAATQVSERRTSHGPRRGETGSQSPRRQG
jgi:CRISPR type III-A-associated protein Csm2